MATKILAVDDESDYLELLQLNLEIEGYSVATANDGAGAIKCISSERPDLILMDVKLGDDCGFKITFQIKQDPATEDIPVIMVTGEGTDEDKKAGYDAGADDYVVKPYEINDLVTRIEAVLSKKPASVG